MLKGRNKETLEDVLIKSPLNGELVDIKDVKDPVFSKELLGKGIAIIPDDGNVYAPAAGYVRALIPSNHAIGLQLETGEQVLIHVGIDTANLNGSGFTTHVKKNQTFKKGDLLLEFDKGFLLGRGYDITTSIVITNSNEFTRVEPITELKHVTVDDEIIVVYKY